MNIRYLPVPKPQKAVSDCGMAIEMEAADLSRAAGILAEKGLEVQIFLKDDRGEVHKIEPYSSGE